MLSGLDAFIVIGIGAALMAPLLYGLATLRGMRRKWVYPLLRLRRQDGRLSSVTVTKGLDSAGNGLSKDRQVHI
jgi:hypothetical protein